VGKNLGNHKNKTPVVPSGSSIIAERVGASFERFNYFLPLSEASEAAELLNLTATGE